MYRFIVFSLLILQSCLAQQNKIQTTKSSSTSIERPKLVVGLIVDQMRDEYLYRFYDKFGQGGFKRLMNDGHNFRNTHYHYASTVTGPGHAHVYTGSVPAFSGIVGNEWYDKASKSSMYVVEDTTVTVVGEGSANAGKMSPTNLKVTSISDQLRIATQFGSKVIGVAIKDRGAILPAGHTGEAYWFDSGKGNWITSSFYKDQLPEWVKKFNDQKLAQKYAAAGWLPNSDLSTYTESEDDDQPYESKLSGEAKAVFPHKLSVGNLANSPAGSTLSLDFALEALQNEGLGQDKVTDILALSFSSPDYAGHSFGPQSKEVEDIYIRLDQEIERLLNQLDAKVGKGNYTVFLTADHAVAEIPAFLKKHNIPSGLLLGSEFKNLLNKSLAASFGDGQWVEQIQNYQIYLNKALLKEKKVSVEDIRKSIYDEVVAVEGVHNLVNLEDGQFGFIPQNYQGMLSNLYYPKRSGELMVVTSPGWFQGYTTGTTHGTMWPYDTHVPLLWYGWGVPAGETFRSVYISDIAPTLAQMLHILEPNGNVGKPLLELFGEK